MAYTKHTWVTGETITAANLNHLEQGVYDATEIGTDAYDAIASAYDNTRTYGVGDYVIYNNDLYRCTTAITTAEAWTAAHWTATVLGDDVAGLKSDSIKNLGARLSDVDGLIVPQMEHGGINMASTAISFATSTIDIRTPQNGGIRVKPTDVVYLTDYTNAELKVAVLKDSDNKYAYTSYQSSDYLVANDGVLYLVVRYRDQSTVTNVADLASLIRIDTHSNISTVQKVEALESYTNILESHSLPVEPFGNGTFQSGVYNPTLRKYRVSTKYASSYDFDIYIKAKSGFRFICYTYYDNAWHDGSWVTESSVSAGIPFGLLIARVTENASEVANISEFVSALIINTNLTNSIEEPIKVNSSAISTFMNRFYASSEVEAYAFFTDPHLMGTNGTFSESAFNSYIKELRDTVNATSAEYVVCGGDWLSSGDTKAQASVKLGYVDGRMRSMFPNKYYPIVGNHDFNYLGVDGDGNRLSESNWISNSAMRNFLFHEYDNCYYKFKRHLAQNYVLNTRQDYDGTNAYDKTMLDWLASNLIEDDAPHSTIMFHIYYLSSVGTTIPTRIQAIGAIISAFNSHTTCTLTNATHGYDKTYDFTNTTGHVDYVIVGHTHSDFSDTLGGVPVIGCDNFTEGGKATFDLVFADYTNSKVYTTRIGSGSSREFNI